RAPHEPAAEDRAQPGRAPLHRHRARRRVSFRSAFVNVKPVGRWVLWPGILLLVTFVLFSVRTEAAQSYVPLVYLLVVLGGSIGGGHPLGFTLATASVLLMDYYFQVPYNR